MARPPEGKWWRARAEVEDGSMRGEVRMEHEAMALRAFIEGPEDDGEYERVDWSRAQRREEIVLRNGKRWGFAVVYEAPIQEA